MNEISPGTPIVYGPSPDILDLAQVAPSPGQSPKVRAGTAVPVHMTLTSFQPRQQHQPQGHQYRHHGTKTTLCILLVPTYHFMD